MLPTATRVTKGGRGDFGWMFRLLSAVTATLAIAALAKHALVTWSLSAPMTLVMDAYKATTQLVLGWAEPYLQAAVMWVGDFFHWRPPPLNSAWKDMLVIMGITIGPAAMLDTYVGLYRWVNIAAATLTSLLLSLLVGVFAAYENAGILLTLIILIGGFVLTLLMFATAPYQKGKEAVARAGAQASLAGFIGAFCFFAIDAGLKLLGA